MNTKEFKEKIFDFTDTQDWKFKGTTPCVIDFYADWCGPCKAIAPVLDELSDEYGGKVEFFKVDTDKETELASLFGIRSIPTLLLIPSKGNPEALVGVLPKEKLKEAIDDKLLG